jgi:S-adenosylmethionine hydrolase
VSGRIQGKIVEVGDTGNLVTDITSEQLRHAPTDLRAHVVCDEHETFGIFPTDHGQPESTLIAILGARGVLELEIVGLSARDMLGVRVGEAVVVEWQ